jgi:hypothetical protein
LTHIYIIRKNVNDNNKGKEREEGIEMECSLYILQKKGEGSNLDDDAF